MTVLTPKVPAGMVDLMKSLSKSVLKEKPENIYEYAAAYFESMLKKRDGSLDKGYGKFRSYQKYCAFVEKMQVRQQKMDKQNEETDSGVGSSNTDDETTKTACDEAVASSSSALKMAVNGVAIQASKRNAKPPVQQKKTKNYSVNPKLKAQGSIERDRKGRAEAKDTNAALTKKSKAKPRKLSSKKPSENLIVITEETSADVAEVDEVVKMSSAAAKIQRAFRKYQRDKEMERVNVVPAVTNSGMNENMAAAIIQRLFKYVLSTKHNLTEKIHKENIKNVNDGDLIAVKEDDQVLDSTGTETTSKDLQIAFFVDAENDKERSINQLDAKLNIETLDQANDEKSDDVAIITEILQDSAVTNQKMYNEDIASVFKEPTHPDNVNEVTDDEIVVEQTNLDHNEVAKRNIKVSFPEQKPIPLNELKPEIANEENALLSHNIQNIEETDNNSQPHAGELNDNIVDKVTDAEIVIEQQNLDHNEVAKRNIKDSSPEQQPIPLNELKYEIEKEENALLSDNIQINEKTDDISQSHTGAENGMAKTVQTTVALTEVKPTEKEHGQAIQQLDRVVGILGTNLDKEQLELTAGTESPIDQPTEYELAETVILDRTDDEVQAYVLNSELTENSGVKDNVEQMIDQTKDAKVASFEEVGLKLIPSDIIENPMKENYVEPALNISKAGIGHVVSENNSKLNDITGQNIFEIEDEVGKEDFKDPTNANDEPTIMGIGNEEIDVRPIETFTMESDKDKISTAILDTSDSISIIQEAVENVKNSKIHYNPPENIEVKASEPIKSEKLSENIDDNNTIVEELKSIDKSEIIDSAPIQLDADHIIQKNDLQTISGFVPDTVEPLQNFKDMKPNSNEETEVDIEQNIKLSDVPGVSKESENSNVHDEMDLNNRRSKRELMVEDNEINKDDLVDYSEGKAAGESHIISGNLNTGNAIETVESHIKIDDLNADNVIEPITRTECNKEVITINSDGKLVPSASAESPNLHKEDKIDEHSTIEQNIELNSDKILETNMVETVKFEESDECLITNNEIDQTVDLNNEVNLKIPQTTIESNSEVNEITELLYPNKNDIDLTKQNDGIPNEAEIDSTPSEPSIQLQNEEYNADFSKVIDKTYIIETNQNISDEVSAKLQSLTNDQLENETNNYENVTKTIDNNTIGMEAVREIIIKDPENQMGHLEAVAVENEMIEEVDVAGDPTDEQIFERNSEKQIVVVEKVTGEIIEQDPKNQIIEKEAVSGEPAVEFFEKVPENHEIVVETEKNSHLEALLPDAHFTESIDSTGSSHENFNNSRSPKTEESAIDQNSDLLVIGNEVMNSTLYAKLETLEVCNEPLPTQEDTSKTTAFGEYVNQIDDKSLVNSNQILLSNHDDSVDIIKEEDSDDCTDTDNLNESGNTTVRDWCNAKEKSTTATDVQYELLSSDLSGTEEKNPEEFKESGVDETSRDELDDMSEVENFDLSSCGEDSLEAMYYSLRKNEIMVDKMHRRASEQRGVAEYEPDVEDKKELNEQKMPFPTKITEHLDSAMNEVQGSGKSDKIATSIGSDSDDVIVGNMNDGFPENTSNLSTTETDVEPIQLTIDSPIKTNSKVSDDDVFMNPMNYAMQQKDELLQRMHGTWFQETINQSNESDQYNEDLDAFPDNPNYASSASNQRKMWTTSVSEADSDYMESAGNRRLTKDDFNISTAFDHLTSTDSDSTIVSAATKIQAGARGFLTRRRLRRSSMGTTLSPDNTHCSFGNAAIDKSLEDLIEQQEIISQDDAAIKIQHSYRRYRNKKLRMLNDQITLDAQSGDSQYDIEQYSIDDDGEEDVQHGIIEIKCEQKKMEQPGDTRNVQSTSQSPHGLPPREAEERYENIIISNEYVEQQQHIDDADYPKIDANDAHQQQKYHQLSTATGNTDVLDTAQRRQTLQRGDAVQRHSTPEEIEALLQQQHQPKPPVSNATEEQEASEINLETGEPVIRSSSLNTTKRAVSIRRLGHRQKSMPVQIDTEIMRMIPKHLRKRIKSADSMKRRSN